MEIRMRQLLNRFKNWVKKIKTEVIALYVATKDPRTPWFAKLFAVMVVAYFFSPIDLIPDFIPVLGYLDDLILVPLGIAIALKMIPDNVLEDSRIKAQAKISEGKPVSRIAAMIIILIWLSIAVIGSLWLYRTFV
jgi:uncharacterized membrane protein YkvA (DUF1232 family)